MRVAEQQQQQFQMGFVGDVLNHDLEVRAVQQNLSKQLQGLSTRNVIFALNDEVYQAEKRLHGTGHEFLGLQQQRRK